MKTRDFETTDQIEAELQMYEQHFPEIDWEYLLKQRGMKAVRDTFNEQTAVRDTILRQREEKRKREETHEIDL